MKPAQPAFSLLFFLTSHETLLYHWATCKENNTKAQLMFCQPFIVEEFLLGSSQHVEMNARNMLTLIKRTLGISLQSEFS